MVLKMSHDQYGFAAEGVSQNCGPSAASSSVPWPGSTYIIRHDLTGQVLTLLNGKVILTQPDNKYASIHWECMETKGWLGFKEPVSGLYLGHDAGGKLICQAWRQQGWENFVVRPTPDGGYILLLTHWEKLWPVGFRKDHEGETLAKIESGSGGEFVWEFIKV